MENILASLKAVAALVGSAATAALGILPPAEYRWLAVVAAVCTAVATYAVPNIPAKVNSAPRHSTDTAPVA